VSIRDSRALVTFWRWPETWLHVFKHVNDGHLYALISTQTRDWQVWPPPLARWHWKRFR
jgi:hypothetical protein